MGDERRWIQVLYLMEQLSLPVESLGDLRVWVIAAAAITARSAVVIAAAAITARSAVVVAAAALAGPSDG